MTDEKIHDKLRKLLALTESPNEHESALAMAKLHELLTKHNLSMADLEKKGANAPKIGEQGYDLGKAAFKWKLELAEGIAEFYYCAAIVNPLAKTVSFVGRPDNVEALKMTYGWVIQQVQRIAKEERRTHFDTTGEHIDPLRWQVNFGMGAVPKLVSRLQEMKARQEEDLPRNEYGDVVALAVHHQSEVSDYLEQIHGYRTDGRPTKEEEERRKRYEESNRRWMERLERDEAERLALKAKCEASGDMAPYYTKFPWESPEAIAKAEKKAEAERKKEERNERRRTGNTRERRIDERKEEQAYVARQSGKENAGKVNLQPFVGDGKRPTKGRIG